MITITLKEIESKELPMYVEHMGRFYLLSAVPADWTLIPPVHPAGGTSLEVYGARAYNVYTAEEFKEVLGGVEDALAEERKTEISAQDGNHVLGKKEILAAQEQKAADLSAAAALVSASLPSQPEAEGGNGSLADKLAAQKK